MGTVKGEQMEEEVVTVGSKKELAELLMSKPGVKWTSDEFEQPDKEWCCFNNEYSDNPFVFSNEYINGNMGSSWNIKTWRKVNPRFERGDLVVCWDDEDVDSNGLDVRVWNETGVFKRYRDEGNVKFDNYGPYTGPVPKHIQDFIDEIKAKEK